MKNIFYLILLLNFSIYGQTTETIVDSSFTIDGAGYNKAEFTRTVRNKKTNKTFYFFFQNYEYKHITDIGSIAIYDRSSLLLFAKKLKEFANIESGKQLQFECKSFKIIRYDFTNDIYLESRDGKTFLIPNGNDNNGAVELAEFILRNINFFPKVLPKKK